MCIVVGFNYVVGVEFQMGKWGICLSVVLEFFSGRKKEGYGVFIDLGDNVDI